MLTVSDVSELKMLTMLLKDNTAIGNQIIKLYVNNVTPTEESTATTFTEMSTHGYAAKTLTRGNWTIADVTGVSTASYAQQIWAFTSATPAVNVYGYFVIDATSGALLWAEKFSTVQIISNIGDEIRITPKLTLS